MDRAETSEKASLPSTLVSDRLLTWTAMGFLLAILIFFLLYPVYDICKLSFYREGVLTLRNYAFLLHHPRMFRS